MVPVVSVGNITTGGTGKTPFVAYLSRWFCDAGVRVGILSRGYRSLPDRGNDEMLVLDQLCPNVPHIQNRDRVESAHVAWDEFDCQILILDDGFQHRRLARDLDIVLIDALNPWGFGCLLPRGLLREPISVLKNADLIVLTRADQCSDEHKAKILTQLAEMGLAEQCVEVSFRPTRLINYEGQTADLRTLVDQRVFGFCGVGNPQSFQQTLNDTSAIVAAIRYFNDHHHYSLNDLVDLERQIVQHRTQFVVTTFKDLVKINRTHLGSCPLWAIDITTQILRQDELLQQRLRQLLSV